ncbi:MAG: esterase [Candidatus Hydrogenedentota bacterium]
MQGRMVRPVRVAGLCLLIVVACMGGACPKLPQGTVRTTIEHGGRTRTYLVYVPESYTPGTPTPVVLALHPFSLTGVDMQRKSGFDVVADREGFLVCYPDAVSRVWNGDPTDETQGPGEDDPGYIAAVLDQLAIDYSLDANKVFVAGMSNGALMTYRLACELSDRITAIAGVACTLPAGFGSFCAPVKPLPVMMMMGVADPFFPWEGGTVNQGPFMQVQYQSAADSVAHWIGINNAGGPPQVEELPDTDPMDGTRVFRETHAANPGGHPVVFYRIEGGGHTWPGGYTSVLEQLVSVGNTSRDINAAEAIWAFFASVP